MSISYDNIIVKCDGSIIKMYEQRIFRHLGGEPLGLRQQAEHSIAESANRTGWKH